jgi:hypothetical protein
MKILFVIMSLLVSTNAFALDPYLYEMQEQTRLMRQQQLDNMRYQQQQQHNYNAANRTRLDPTILQQSQMPNFSETYANAYAQGQQARLMEIQIAREEAALRSEQEAAEAQAVQDETDAKMDKLMADARTKYGVKQ